MFWKRGQKSAVAKAAGISLPYLCDLLARRRNISVKKAKIIRDAIEKITGKRITLGVLVLKLNHKIYGE
jgi:DNA-binding transcriptional regulator YdaS (Cro superfamily)